MPLRSRGKRKSYKFSHILGELGALCVRLSLISEAGSKLKALILLKMKIAAEC
jgi:hypothetical protein